MIVDCHAHIGLKKHMPAQFLEEMLQPFFRAAGAEIPASYVGDPRWQRQVVVHSGLQDPGTYSIGSSQY